jgi:hypothetical protein
MLPQTPIPTPIQCCQRVQCGPISLRGETVARVETFIRHYDGALPPAFCREVRERFDVDTRAMAGAMNEVGGNAVLTGKTTTEIVLSSTPGWEDVDARLKSSMAEHFPRYRDAVKFLAGSDHKDLMVEALRVKRYPTGGSFEWHIDNSGPQTRDRVLAVQWYFNSVAEGGRTEFQDLGAGVEAVEGRILFFPVTWIHRHRGAPALSGPKYIATTFVHRQW